MFNNSFAYNPFGTEMCGITRDVRSAYKKIMWGVGGNPGSAEAWIKKSLGKIQDYKEELIATNKDFNQLLKSG